jgi:hypothetical protein
MSQRMGRMHGGLVRLALLCAFSFGAIVTIARADSYHVTCVGHGFVEGGSQTDGSFFSRVETGCSSTYYFCAVKVSGSTVGGQEAYGTTTCNAWSRDYGDYTECHGSADVYDQGVFSEHIHTAPNWCG